MTIEVMETGPMSSIQDMGRRGYERFGVPPSGPMDEFAFRAANALVGNSANAAGVETSLMPLRLRCLQNGVVALCGCGYQLFLNEIKMPSWTAVWFKYGDEILFQPDGFGLAEIAFSGGIIVPERLGSKATNQRARLGGIHGNNLQQGDVFVLGDPAEDPVLMSGTRLPELTFPTYGTEVQVGVVWGPHLAHFSKEAQSILLEEAFSIQVDSDRMGYRLNGKPLPMVKPADILSEGMVMGAIQVPASGLPMIMLADRPATGGYARIGTVIRADLPLLVQSAPGQGQIRFYAVDVETAQEKYKRQIRDLYLGIDRSKGMVLANIVGSHQ